MNLDDNITMIGHFTENCRGKQQAQKEAFTILNEKITNIKEPNEIELNKCGNLSIYELYKKLKEDMKNPMYDKDPAFRKKVETKLSRSNIL
jgi:hypothetical protein